MGLKPGHQDHRHQARPHLHRFLHQRPYRGSARSGKGGRRQDRQRQSQCDDRAGLRHRKEQAEAEGLDKIFIKAGFEWREPGCSMCLAMTPDKLKPEERCASTSNRNFEGRQGFKGRTPSGLAGDGGGSGNRRAFRRHQGVAGNAPLPQPRGILEGSR